jgi:oligopeptide/dipeptide ABC transporter ATP-binding protein
MGPVRNIFYEPQHAYTLGLMQASPRLSSGREELAGIPGSPPDLIEPPPGCKFHIRCPFAVEMCRATPPKLEQVQRGHIAACYKSDEVLAESRSFLASYGTAAH